MILRMLETVDCGDAGAKPGWSDADAGVRGSVVYRVWNLACCGAVQHRLDMYLAAAFTQL